MLFPNSKNTGVTVTVVERDLDPKQAVIFSQYILCSRC
jgi:hypothetical protein